MDSDQLDLAWNDEIYEDVGNPDYQSVVVYSRDWTVDTIRNQIEQGNIDLNPNFQRRNAWNDEKRSRLIESLIIGVPIPEVVLAEDPNRRKSFIVIDGKQRLLTIMGFLDPKIGYWNRPKLSKIKSGSSLIGLSYEDLSTRPEHTDDHREFLNSDIRCTVISNYSSNDVLYDIFYRLNTGSVPLSTQELRQVLNRGDFANALLEYTNTLRPIHTILNLSEPDPRLRDAELLLRAVAIQLFGDRYAGNLKRFLDESMEAISRLWSSDQGQISDVLSNIDAATRRAIDTLGKKRVGRKFRNGSWETRFNRSIFEAQVFYFGLISDDDITESKKAEFSKAFETLCTEDKDFLSAVEATTKTNESYEIRFQAIRNLFNEVFGTGIDRVPILKS